MVFQSYALFPHMNVFENVAFGLRAQKMDKALIAPRVEESLALVQLEGLGKRAVTELSGGQQQRVAIARAVIGRPQLLLADEPTGSVDGEIGMRLIGLIQALHREGTTVVIATHDRALVQGLGYPEFRLADGKLVRVNTGTVTAEG